MDQSQSPISKGIENIFFDPFWLARCDWPNSAILRDLIGLENQFSIPFGWPVLI
jgi:hypothetical protein